MKSTLARLGIRAEEKLVGLRTADEAPLPENTYAELRRDMTRLDVICNRYEDFGAAYLAGILMVPAYGVTIRDRGVGSI
jgi:hypothetical protein